MVECLAMYLKVRMLSSIWAPCGSKKKEKSRKCMERLVTYFDIDISGMKWWFEVIYFNFLPFSFVKNRPLHTWRNWDVLFGALSESEANALSVYRFLSVVEWLFIKCALLFWRPEKNYGFLAKSLPWWSTLRRHLNVGWACMTAKRGRICVYMAVTWN